MQPADRHDRCDGPPPRTISRVFRFLPIPTVLAMLAALPNAARAEQEASESVADPAAAGLSAPGGDPLIWTVDGCAAVLAQVRDAATGRPIAGARVAVLPRGAAGEMPLPDGISALSSPDLRRIGRTSAEGTLVLPPPGGARVVVSLPGWETTEVAAPCAQAITLLAVALEPLPAAKTASASAGGDAHRRLEGDTLETMAGAPRNVFQAVQTVPGVARPTFGGALLGSILGSGDLGVRGARPGESRTYLDGIEIPYYYHYFGLSSVVPAEMIELVDFVPGGAGPQFGRLTGGVLDIHSKALRGEEADGWGDREPWHGRANLTFFEANAIARGPVGNGYLSISDRFSLMDLIYRANEKNWSDGNPVWGYNDYQVVWKTRTGPGAELSALVLGAFDDVRLVNRPTRLHTEFHRAGLSWQKRDVGTRLRLAASYGFDRFRLNVLEPGEGLRMASHKGLHDARVAVDGERAMGSMVTLRAGAEAHAVRPEAGIRLDYEEQEWFIVDRTYWDRGYWTATWAEAELRPHARIVVLPGVRFDYDSFARRGWVDPRLTARWFLDDVTTVSASGGLYRRPHPFALAFADDLALGLTESQQVSAGIERRFGPGLVLDARVFRNAFRDQVQGIEWLPDFDEYGYHVLGDGHSTGGELFGRWSSRDERTRAEVGYSFSRTRWRNVQTRDAWTAADLDSTHAFTLVASRATGRNWNVGVRARWYSGLPYTTFAGDLYVPDGGGYIGVGESPFAERAPSFFQADLRIAKAWRAGRRVGIETFLDIQNVTARNNVDRLTTESGRPTDPAVQAAMPFFPSLGVSVTF